MSRHYLYHTRRAFPSRPPAFLFLILILLAASPALGGGKNVAGAPGQGLAKGGSPLSQPGEVFDYFREVALNIEITTSQQGIVRKWSGEAGVEILGAPSMEDRRTIDTVLAELNELTGKSFRMHLVDSGGDIRIHIGPMNEFPAIEPNYVRGNTGFVWVRWRGNVIYDANILVDNSQTNQVLRNHYLREELVQALGLLGDSLRYPDSIFYDKYTETSWFTDLDKQVVRMLYDPRVQPGMDDGEVAQVLGYR